MEVAHKRGLAGLGFGDQYDNDLGRVHGSFGVKDLDHLTVEDSEGRKA